MRDEQRPDDEIPLAVSYQMKYVSVVDARVTQKIYCGLFCANVLTSKEPGSF
jgi:hypothetical protein